MTSLAAILKNDEFRAGLKTSVGENSRRKPINAEVWRDGQSFRLALDPGKLDVVFDPRPESVWQKLAH